MNILQKMLLKFSAKSRMKRRVEELNDCYIPRKRGKQMIGFNKVVDLDAAFLLYSTVELKYDSEFTKVIPDSEGIAKVRYDWYKTRKGNIVCVTQLYGLDIQNLGLDSIKQMTIEELREEYTSTHLKEVIEDNMHLIGEAEEEKEEI